MTRKKTPAANTGGGVSGVLFVCCAAMLVAGIAADFLSNADVPFWLGAEDGGASAIGAGAAAFVIVAGYVAHLALAGADAERDGKEKRRARPDA